MELDAVSTQNPHPICAKKTLCSHTLILYSGTQKKLMNSCIARHLPFRGVGKVCDSLCKLVNIY